MGQLARGREMVSVPGVCLQHLSLCGFWGWREGGSRIGGSERAQGAADQSQKKHIFFSFPIEGLIQGPLIEE